MTEQHIFKCTAVFPSALSVCFERLLLWLNFCIASSKQCSVHQVIPILLCDVNVFKVFNNILAPSKRVFCPKVQFKGVWLRVRKKLLTEGFSFATRVPRPISKGENGLKKEKVGAPKEFAGTQKTWLLRISRPGWTLGTMGIQEGGKR